MYHSKLNIKETQLAIQDLKFTFTKQLYKKLNLFRVSPPLFVRSTTKINDSLNGEAPVTFFPKNVDVQCEIVHSLAKWKRYALNKYKFDKYEGIWTDMNAIRQEENLDELHSFYVDQWDWELIIDEKDRNLDFLKKTVGKIFQALRYTENKLNFKYSQLKNKLPEKLVFISSQELLNLYPNIKPEERELEFARKNPAFFVYKIGYPLSDQIKHSARAFDYDDWELNGDLIVYDSIFDRVIELSSMGIRVDKKALKKQIKYDNKTEKDLAEFHYKILRNELPYTIGGGIGQSRVSMFLLEKKHIGEVQVGVWSNEIINNCEKNGVKLL